MTVRVRREPVHERVYLIEVSEDAGRSWWTDDAWWPYSSLRATRGTIARWRRADRVNGDTRTRYRVGVYDRTCALGDGRKGTAKR